MMKFILLRFVIEVIHPFLQANGSLGWIPAALKDFFFFLKVENNVHCGTLISTEIYTYVDYSRLCFTAVYDRIDLHKRSDICNKMQAYAISADCISA